jgi:hypothetical protein
MCCKYRRGGGVGGGEQAGAMQPGGGGGGTFYGLRVVVDFLARKNPNFLLSLP